MRKIKLLFISTMMFVTLAFGQGNTQGKLSNYTRFVLSAVENRNVDADTLSVKKLGLKSIQGTEYVSCFIKLTNTDNLDELRALGVSVNTVTPSIITAQVPVNQIETIAALPQVLRLEVATPVAKKQDKARATAFVDSVHQGVDLPRAFKGQDVVVGVIDGGFEYGHINFYDNTGTTLRVKRVWNQNETEGTHPTSYNYGAEYATTADILAAETDDGNETHATHVTGIAAGAYGGLNYAGVAPEADIVMVSFADSYDDDVANDKLIDGINYVYNYAASVGKPAVANMSLGWHLGPHDGTSLFDQMCDQLQGAGKLLVGAAGNEGGDNLHVSKTFNAITDTLRTFIDVYPQEGGYADIWGTENQEMKIKVVIYKKATNQILYQTPFLDANVTEEHPYRLRQTDAAGATGRIYVSTEQNAQNNKPNAFVQIQAGFSLDDGNYIGIIIVADNGATVHGWCADGYSVFKSNSVSGWTNGNANSSVGEIGGSGNRIISVGAFTSRNTYTKLNGGNVNTGASLNAIASFSSKGPMADGRVKPDVAAPGAMLVSSFNAAAVRSTGSDYYSDNTNKVRVNGKDYYFGVLQGTSMASPFVAGVLALWLEANPQLTPEDVRQILATTSTTDNYTGTVPAAGSNTWGYGKINAWGGIKSILNTLGMAENTVTQQFATITNPVSGAAKITFKYSDTNVSAYVMDMNGRILIDKKISQITENQQENISETAALPTGTYILYIKGNQKRFAQKIIVK